MMRIVLFGLLLLLPRSAVAQHGARMHGLDERAVIFVRQVELAARRFQTVSDAVVAGYRRIGPEFPAMGQHWIHPGLIVAGEVNPERPPVLCFARIDGTQRLIAVAFTVPLAAGEEPPEQPLGKGIWHDHASSVDEEGLLLAHPSSHEEGDAGHRLAMFHAWIGVENRVGVFSQNNFDLPFVQLGIPAPEKGPSQAAAQALSLLTAGPDYYVALFAVAADLDEAEVERVRGVLDRQKAKVAAWAASPTGIADLVASWRATWAEVAGAVPRAKFERLRSLSGSE